MRRRGFDHYLLHYLSFPISDLVGACKWYKSIDLNTFDYRSVVLNYSIGPLDLENENII